MEYNDCVFSKLFICCNRISYYNQMLLFSQSLSQIKFYTELIEKELSELKKSRKYCENSFKISEMIFPIIQKELNLYKIIDIMNITI
nr:hypothetical protein [Clostridium botulinum]